MEGLRRDIRTAKRRLAELEERRVWSFQPDPTAVSVLDESEATLRRLMGAAHERARSDALETIRVRMSVELRQRVERRMEELRNLLGSSSADARVRSIEAQQGLGRALDDLDARSSARGEAIEELERGRQTLAAKIEEAFLEREVFRLESEQRISELVGGLYCSECKRAASDIERQGEAFLEHIDRVEGTPTSADQATLARARADMLDGLREWDIRIDSLHAERALQEREALADIAEIDAAVLLARMDAEANLAALNQAEAELEFLDWQRALEGHARGSSAPTDGAVEEELEDTRASPEGVIGHTLSGHLSSPTALLGYFSTRRQAGWGTTGVDLVANALDHGLEVAEQELFEREALLTRGRSYGNLSPEERLQVEGEVLTRRERVMWALRNPWSASGMSSWIQTVGRWFDRAWVQFQE